MLKITVILSVLLALFSFGISEVPVERVTYHGHQVLRCIPKTKDQVKKLQSLDLDYWLEPRKPFVPVDIGASTAQRASIEEMLKASGIEYSVMIEDMQVMIDEEAQRAANTDTPFLQNYHEWSDIYAYLDSLAASFPSLATTSVIGKTYLGKDIKIIKISSNPAANKPTMWFDGGLHAREWITVGTVTYFADTLVRSYSDASSAAHALLQDFDVIICPVINVDGYDYTWHGDRNWRKTRSPNAKSACVGTDPNRNWAFHWGEAGANNIPCSDSYQGPSPASEVEVQAVQSYICAHNSTIKSYVNFHSYGQLWMSNWGYTDELPPDYKQQNDLSAAAVAAIKAVHGTAFEYGPISTTIYPASGSSADYTYGVCGIKYSYGAELRDTGKYGFLLPADQIVPSGEEMFAGMAAMAKFIKQNP